MAIYFYWFNCSFVLKMRKPTLFILLLCIGLSSLYAQTKDNFGDGNFTNPDWFGDTLKFAHSSGHLQSASTEVGDVFYISTPQSFTSKHEWRLWMDLNFKTSSANYVDFYLASDSENLANTQNGTYIRIGNTKDEIALYSIENGNHSLVADGPDNQTENKSINLKIERDVWFNVFADFTGGQNYSSVFSSNEFLKGNAQWCGILIKQSSASFFSKHFIDDFYSGPKQIDTIPPEIINSSWSNSTVLNLTANEALLNHPSTSFNLSPTYGQPSEVKILGEQIELVWDNPIINGNYTLDVIHLTDVSGNYMDTTLAISYFVAPQPEPEEIIISEIMADPSPPQNLPEVEYIELWNTTSKVLSLDNLTFTDGGAIATFPDQTIPAYSYVIVCKTGNAAALQQYGRVIEVNNFPALNNSGDNLELKLGANIIDQVTYTEDWYGDPIKKNGGYSLELIDNGNTCPTQSNWIASPSLDGGSPGSASAIFGLKIDTIAPNIEMIKATSKTIILELSETAQELENKEINNFRLSQSGVPPIEINQVDGLVWELIFADSFELNTVYKIEIDDLSDCKGNYFSNLKVPFSRLLQARPGDIIINEILFNPKDDGSDFIEMVNTSKNFIDLNGLTLAKYQNGELKDKKQVSINSLSILPGEFVALTKDELNLRKRYICGDFIIETTIPPLNNDEGILMLLGNNNLVLDSVYYNENQHFELLSTVDGVSLERISLIIPGWNTSNWHSASTSAGFATPALPNSQAVNTSQTSSFFKLESNTISPDGDGYEDLLVLHYALESAGYVGNVYIYSLNGFLVEHPINNQTLSTEGLLTWDGIKSNGTKIPSGNYIALLDFFNLDGKRIKKKLAFSVIGTF